MALGKAVGSRDQTHDFAVKRAQESRGTTDQHRATKLQNGESGGDHRSAAKTNRALTAQLKEQSRQIQK
jgi:hypothetical protein